MTQAQSTNNLSNENSPYLRQHAHNPVNWYPWGPVALAKARTENKPILLSIGYAACHWCHVMAHESFEDNETAELMNELFINIKVDREERPDLDKVYQTAHYFLTQQNGGWPLTIFLTPDELVPFYSGTYFPLVQSYGLPSFKQVLRSIADAYQNKQSEIRQQNNYLMQALRQEPAIISDVRLNEQPIQHAIKTLNDRYDSLNGGFGDAPKFPQASRLEFLLHTSSAILTINTLKAIAQSGLTDQLGGGFFRYSVDAAWIIPHFEKMLYDNGQLLFLYVLADKYFIHGIFQDVIQQTCDWLLHTMQAEKGGFYSSLDADSEGEEGKYYIWDKMELMQLLTPEENAVITFHFGLNLPANFEKHWHLYATKSLQQVATDLDLSIQAVNKLYTSAKEKMLAVRKKRNAPNLDDKILIAWNALTIKGLLWAGAHLQKPDYTHAALKALTFIQQTPWRDKAYLDDYAFLIDALLTALQLEWDTNHLEYAIELADAVLLHFVDHQAGGFYFTANEHEKLLYRPKTMMDEAIPAGNGSLVRSFFLLGYLLGDNRYLSAAEKILHAAWPTLTQYPAEHCSLLMGLQEFLRPPQIVILRGDAAELKSWQSKSQKINNYVFAIPDTEMHLPGLLNEKKPHAKPHAYICEGTTCQEIELT